MKIDCTYFETCIKYLNDKLHGQIYTDVRKAKKITWIINEVEKEFSKKKNNVKFNLAITHMNAHTQIRTHRHNEMK